MIPFGLKIAIINRAFRKRLDEKASAMGLTSVQLRVLGSISRLEASGETEIHQNDLEQIEHVTHPAMTKLLQRLESKDFIRCVPSVRDGDTKRSPVQRSPLGSITRFLHTMRKCCWNCVRISPRIRKRPCSRWRI